MLQSKSHPEIILHKWISRNSNLKMPRKHPLSTSLEGKEKDKTSNKYLSKEKANCGQINLLTLSFMFCLLRKTSSLLLISKVRE